MGSDGKVKGAYLESGNFLTLLPNNSLTHIEENFAPVKVLLEKVNKNVLRQDIGEEQSTCPDNCSQCIDYQDVVTNPRLNNQSDNVNKNRFHRKERTRMKNGKKYTYYHTGTDILASSGDEVYAMLCGEVYSVVNTFKPNEYKADSLGNYLVIKSKDKDERVVYLQYCHLDEILVKKGQKIRHGEIIGKAGSTGNAASVYDEKGKLIHGIYPQYRHIHIEAFLESFSKKNRIDPEQFMKTKFDETTKGNVIK